MDLFLLLIVMVEKFRNFNYRITVNAQCFWNVSSVCNLKSDVKY